MKKSGTSGRETDGTPYVKPDGITSRQGAVYTVAGSSGKLTGSGSLNHPAMFTSLRQLGSMVIDVDGNKLTARFLRENDRVDDEFTIIKGGTTPPPDTQPPTVPTGLVARATSNTAAELTWQASTDNVGVRGYKVLRNDVVTDTAANTSYTNAGLSANTTYRFRVQAFDAAGNESAQSSDVSVTTPATPPPAAGPAVLSFTVVNADTGADIATFTGSGTLSNRPPNINVRANVSSTTRVVFTDGITSKTENSAPYAYKGDSNGVYAKWSPTNGTYVITATPSNSNGPGTAATLTLTISP
jgi:chitodextrinase